jgi:hypothetical protein
MKRERSTCATNGARPAARYAESHDARVACRRQEQDGGEDEGHHWRQERSRARLRPMWIGKSKDYLGWARRRLHSPRAERMKVTPPSPPSAQSVQTKKKPPVDLAISP